MKSCIPILAVVLAACAQLPSDEGSTPDDRLNNQASAGAFAPWLRTHEFPSPCGVYEYEVVDPVSQTVDPNPIPWMEMQLDARGFPSVQQFHRPPLGATPGSAPTVESEATFVVDTQGRLTTYTLDNTPGPGVADQDWVIEYTYTHHPDLPAQAVMQDTIAGAPSGETQIWTLDAQNPHTHANSQYWEVDQGDLSDWDAENTATYNAFGQLEQVEYYRPYYDSFETWDYNRDESGRLKYRTHTTTSSNGDTRFVEGQAFVRDGSNIEVWQVDSQGLQLSKRQQFELSGDEITSRTDLRDGDDLVWTYDVVADVDGATGFRTSREGYDYFELYEGTRPGFGLPERPVEFVAPWTFQLLEEPFRQLPLGPWHGIPETGIQVIVPTPPGAVFDTDNRRRGWEKTPPQGQDTPVPVVRIRYDEAGHPTQYWKYDSAGELSRIFHMTYDCYAPLVTGTMPLRLEDIPVPAP